MKKPQNILVLGAFGQIGTALVPALAGKFGMERIFCLDHKLPKGLKAGTHIIVGDVANKSALSALIKRHDIKTVYHLAALLSVSAEKSPDLAWDANMLGLKNVLDIARDQKFKVFWPSSIAVYGPTSPRRRASQHAVLEPVTMYGVTKVAGELLCNYYHERYGVDVRSIRYPGVVSIDAVAGGGTTDYAVDMFRAAREGVPYTSYLKPDTMLPMIFIDDAVRATIEIMDAKPAQLALHIGYNISALSFSVKGVAEEIRKHTSLTVRYAPDFRQTIADSWPESVDDRPAQRDWGWKPALHTLPALVRRMLRN